MTEADGAAGSAPAQWPQGVRTPAFRRLWWSWAVSLVGDGVRGLALLLYVALSTKSALSTSAVTAAEVLPWLLCALPAGAIVDRARPTVVITVAHTFRAVLTAGLVLAIVYDFATVPVLCIFAFSLTVAETFAYSASQALMVSLAGPDQLNEANAKFYTVHTIGVNLAGPLAAGGLYLLGPAWAFALDGLTFVVAAVLVAGLPSPRPALAHAVTGRARRLTSEIREGVSLLVRIRGLRVLVSMIATVTLSVSALNTLTPLYAVQELDMKAGLVSTLLVAGALGTLLGTRLATPANRRWSAGPVMIASLLVVAVGMVIFGSVPLAAAALAANALIGVGVGTFNVLAAARRQRLTPQSAMGRISGAYRMLAWGLMPVGAGLAGPLAVATSLGAVFAIAGCLIAVVALLLLRPLARMDTAVSAPRAKAAGPSPAAESPTEPDRPTLRTHQPTDQSAY